MRDSIFSFPLYIYQEMILHEYKIALLLSCFSFFFRNVHTVVHTEYTHLHFHHQLLPFLHISQTYSLTVFLIYISLVDY